MWMALKSGAGFGVGPIDALFNVISQIVGREPEPEQYAINAVTGGMDALGEVTVRLREKWQFGGGSRQSSRYFVASARGHLLTR